MPAKSQAMFKLMAGIASGSIKPKDGLKLEQAREFVESTRNYKSLPKYKKPKKKLKDWLKS